MASAQMLCLVLGVFWFSSWLQRSVIDGGRIQILQANEAISEFLANRIDDLQLDTLEQNSPDWMRLQSLVEEVDLPNDGFVSVVDDATGKVICHPDLNTNPDLASISVKNFVLYGSHGARRFGDLFVGENASPNPGTSSSGFAKMDDGTHLIAAVHLKNHNATLMVHQKEASVMAAVKELLRPVKSIGLGVATLITLLGLTVDSLILQKYEDRVARSNTRLEQLVNIRTKSLVKTRNAIIFGLAKLAESRDTDTGEHLERIRLYVTILAQQLAKRDRSIDRDFISNLALASSLHDIGKVGIPDAVLLKPGRLDPHERKIIEEHPKIGQQCLEAIQTQLGNDDFLEMARMIAESHHEKWDGGGYPRNLEGEEIPLVARIVALADVYDALTTKRPYKDAMPHEKATRIIVEGKGSHFDPDIVDAFLASREEFETVAREHADGKNPAISTSSLLLDVSALLSQPTTHA